MALEAIWTAPKEFIAAVLPASDMNTYISQNLYYLYLKLNGIVCNNDNVVCNNDQVVFNFGED